MFLGRCLVIDRCGSPDHLGYTLSRGNCPETLLREGRFAYGLSQEALKDCKRRFYPTTDSHVYVWTIRFLSLKALLN